jgi:hypothetical protein
MLQSSYDEWEKLEEGYTHEAHDEDRELAECNGCHIDLPGFHHCYWQIVNLQHVLEVYLSKGIRRIELTKCEHTYICSVLHIPLIFMRP